MTTKTYLFIFTCAAILIACSNPVKNKLQGTWRTKDGSGKLRVTDKSVFMDSDEAEDYVIKGDTMLTSYQGNEPFTPFVIKNLDDHHLTLIGPDSTATEYSR